MTAVFVEEQPSFNLAAKRIKPKESISATFRRFNMPESYIKAGKASLRYKNPIEKGIYWYWFAFSVRARDVEKWGVCISCGKPITIASSDAGHFIPAASCGIDLLFDERNVNAECSYCNAWDEMHLLGYAKGLDKRYGVGTADELISRYQAYKAGEPIRDWTKTLYEEKLTKLLAQL